MVVSRYIDNPLCIDGTYVYVCDIELGSISNTFLLCLL